jgi:hypothetical protein
MSMSVPHIKEMEVRLGGIVVPKCMQLRYLSSIIEEHGEIDKNETRRFKG